MHNHITNTPEQSPSPSFEIVTILLSHYRKQQVQRLVVLNICEFIRKHARLQRFVQVVSMEKKQTAPESTSPVSSGSVLLFAARALVEKLCFMQLPATVQRPLLYPS